MMIPDDIRVLCEARSGDVYIGDNSAAKACLALLGIAPGSEFYEFSSTFVLINMTSSHSYEGLKPVADSAGELNAAIPFAWEVWELPSRYIAITSLEGEGGYFYDSDTGKVVDFELAHHDDILTGKSPILGETFFDFIRWFLGESAEIRGYAVNAA